MVKNVSAGLLMYAIKDDKLKVFLVHPGGPFFKNKDNGYWSIPKGLVEGNEDLLDTAKREFEEETGIVPEGEFIPLGTVTQKNNKTVYTWAFEINNSNAVSVKSNLFEMEWPPKSGRKQKFPEIDKGEFFTEESAKEKINPAQIEFIERLKSYLMIGK
jgi:predicted NUDIX family NTP pyrophosphohydrolase